MPLSRRPPKLNRIIVDTSILEQELAPLHTQIEQTTKKLEKLEDELRTVEAELDKFSTARQRVDALREICHALDRLDELNAGDLFWKGIPGSEDASGHLKRVKGRVSQFEKRISGFLEIQTSVQSQIKVCNDELDILYDELNEIQELEEERKEEFVLEREMSSVPYREMIMPWAKDEESETRFRQAILVALLLCIIFGSLIPLVSVPLPDPTVEVVEIPERLAMLVKKEPPIPFEPKPVPQEAKQEEEKPKPKDEAKPKAEDKLKKETSPKGGGPKKKPAKVAGPGGGGGPAARKKAESVGVLAFKNTFKDLMEETPVARLGTEARVKTNTTPRVAGQAVPQRSLVAMQAKAGTSGGISNARVTRNIGRGNRDVVGGGGIGAGGGSGTGTGMGYGQVESSIVGAGGGDPRPLSDGPGPGRTDEEIQIVFDRYKATLYRIYNKELRKDPTLRGKILLRLSIETNGAVSFCNVESTDLKSPSLVAQIVARIKRFNFGLKEGVSKITILYPIDFLPAG